MTKISNPTADLRRSLTMAAMIIVFFVSTSSATTSTYTATLDGASQSPPNASPGTGLAQVDLDDVAHTMRVLVNFQDLDGITTAAHIHAATSVPGEGTAGVATPTPSFPGFPTGVTAGAYDVTLDMTQASSYNASFLAAHGGTTAGAEEFLFASIAAGTAYLNIHTNVYGGGEIRGFFTGGTVPITETTWGRLKTLFR